MNAWKIKTKTSKKKYFAKSPIIPKPWTANNENNKANIPYGASSMSIRTKLRMTLFINSNEFLRGSPAGPRLFSAIPNKRENTIIWSILPSAMAAMGLVGNIFIRTSFKDGAAVDWKAVGKARSIPIPGLNNNAKVKAIDMAIAVVRRYKDKVFILIVPILEVEEMDTTPQTSEKKTKGTITSLNDAINICPTTSNKPSVKKSIKINWPIAPR